MDNLLLRVNNDGILGITTEIRLRQLQFDEWLPDNPLEIWNYNNINTFKHNLLAQILCLINDLGITFKINSSMGKNYKIIPGKFPLIDIFKDEYRYVKNSLRKKEFLYLEQFLYLGSYAMKKWDEHNKLFKGKIPRWWNKIKEYITTDGSLVKEKILREVEYNEVIPLNSQLLPNTKIDGRTKQWVIAKTLNEKQFTG